MIKPSAKICGIKDPQNLTAAVQSGARFVGFVFYPPSPRHVEVDTAKELALKLPTGVRGVGLFVNPTDEQLQNVLGKVQLDIIQLHGDETPERVREIKLKYAMPIIKAFPVRSRQDIAAVSAYEDDIDWILFDAKPPNADLPGGTGKQFDWTLLTGRSFSKPWMLSGGLDADNVADAIDLLGPDAVDISSGVEGARGRKDPAKIQSFLQVVKGA